MKKNIIVIAMATIFIAISGCSLDTNVNPVNNPQDSTINETSSETTISTAATDDTTPSLSPTPTPTPVLIEQLLNFRNYDFLTDEQREVLQSEINRLGYPPPGDVDINPVQIAYDDSDTLYIHVFIRNGTNEVLKKITGLSVCVLVDGYMNNGLFEVAGKKINISDNDVVIEGNMITMNGSTASLNDTFISVEFNKITIDGILLRDLNTTDEKTIIVDNMLLVAIGNISEMDINPLMPSESILWQLSFSNDGLLEKELDLSDVQYAVRTRFQYSW